MNKLICLVSLCISFNAYADILFLNFNRNNSSIAAAQKAAKKRGEKVIVFPNATIKKITPETLKTILAEVEESNISNIVMSGHDGGGHFAGKDGDISKINIANSLGDYPKLTASVKSLVLRGCYSATMGQVQSQMTDDWRILFPNLQFVAGYSDSAESSEKPQSKEFVEDMLSLEAEFLQATDLDKINGTFKKLGLYNQMNAAVWMKPCNECDLNKADSGVYVTSGLVKKNQPAISIADERDRCMAIADKIVPHLEVVANFYNGDKAGFERPPKEHQGTSLRAAYTFLRQNEHCLPILAPEQAEAFNPDRIIRLIYFDYMVSNFQDHYPAAPIQELIAKHMPKEWQEPLKYPDLKTATRLEINQFVANLEGASAHLYQSATSPDSAEGQIAKKLFTHSQRMNAALSNLMPFHVPFSWVSEPHAGVPLSGIH